MTSFQDARDEHFQDVERNKVCSRERLYNNELKLCFV